MYGLFKLIGYNVSPNEVKCKFIIYKVYFVHLFRFLVDYCIDLFIDLHRVDYPKTKNRFKSLDEIKRSSFCLIHESVFFTI